MMDFISEYAVIIVIAITLSMLALALHGLKGSKKVIGETKDWLSRERWKGELRETKLKSWEQTNATYGMDHFYSFNFDLEVNGDLKEYCAAALIRANDICRLKKGLTIIVKYDEMPPKKIAVTDVLYDG
ncbi:hypothetical protein FJU30_03635 [Affinibrenneria salicis]|uniref:DUF3592 domain-containing protein n=1 Tax=Affinibrenneria salicis TaxID=2590031 RepID=A0A5J5G5P8_9GAMM|nr:hypothetical protein [Affinibrenneria salicis]KAA9002630.1 hypothetical protein FJU30_01130 [Affinibrenneria salicis]KAA9003082.1 hypothetical protein FJU30_03635 [Affinibrenneria salicis]